RITGAGSGMGATAAALFAAEGAQVALADVCDDCGAVAERIRADGGDAFFVHADVTNGDEGAAGVRAVVDRWGRLDVLYNHAGIGRPDDALMHELPEEVWHGVMGVNVTGMYLCCRYGIEAMLASDAPRSASIVNTASIAGLVGNSTLPSTAYTVSKGAVMALTKQVAVSYAAEGIRCNAVCPGPILTPILEPFFAEPGVRERFEQRIPLGRMG